MGKGFIYQIDENGARRGKNLDVMYEIARGKVYFKGKPKEMTQFKEGTLFYYSDEDWEDWSGNYKVDYNFMGTITASKIYV